jgi:hypothetical protein
MQRLITMRTIRFENRHVRLRIELLPVGEDVRVQDGAVHLVRVKDDLVGTGGDADKGKTSGFDQTPGSGHRDQVTPRIEHVSVPETKLDLKKYNGQKS